MGYPYESEFSSTKYPSDTRKFPTDKPYNSDFYSKRDHFWTDNAINWPKCLYIEEPISPNTVFASKI